MRRLLALALALAPLTAQEEGKELHASPPRHEVVLRSGSALVGRLEPREWTVATAFGPLKVPVDEIKRVRFGRRSQPEHLAAVEEAITDLGSANPERRDHARARLREAGAFAALSLKRASKDHEDPEVRRLASEILEALAIEPEDYLADDDVLETTRFDLSGTIQLQAFKVEVPELGSLAVRRGDIVQVRRYEADDVRKFTVDGSNVWPNGWLDTKMKFEKGDPIRVNATGMITFPNWGGQAFPPDGLPHMGSHVAGLPAGTLAGRIGEKGTVFRIGSSYAGGAPATGTLQLLVLLNAQGQPHSGNFSVSVRRSPE